MKHNYITNAMKRLIVFIFFVVIFCGCGKEKKTIECYDGKMQLYGSIVMSVNEEKYFSSVYFVDEKKEDVLSKSEVEFTYIGENLDKVKIEATRLNNSYVDNYSFTIKCLKKIDEKVVLKSIIKEDKNCRYKANLQINISDNEKYKENEPHFLNINDENGKQREGYRGSTLDVIRLFLGTPFMGSKANDITIKNIRIIDNPYIKFIGVFVFETEYSSPDYLLFDLKDLRRIDFSKGETLENNLKHGLCMVLDITEENYEIYNKGDAYKYIVNFEFEIESNGSTFYIQREREIGITDLKREYTAKYAEID